MCFHSPLQLHLKDILLLFYLTKLWEEYTLIIKYFKNPDWIISTLHFSWMRRLRMFDPSYHIEAKLAWAYQAPLLQREYNSDEDAQVKTKTHLFF